MGIAKTTPQTDGTTIRLDLVARGDNLSLVRDVLESLLMGHAACRSRDDLVHEIILAVQEACNNVVKHAYPDGRHGPLIVELELKDNELCIEVADDGCGFDPASVEDPSRNPEDAPTEGGYGLFLMRGLMDEVAFETRGARHFVILRKALYGDDV